MLKTASGVAHKTEVGGVKLHLTDRAALEVASADLCARLGPRVLVAPYVASRGVEVALGVLRDPIAGPLVMVGAGGTLVELLDDKRCALAPSDAHEVRALLESLRLRPLLDGVRGRASVDIEALVEAVVRLSVLAADLERVLGEVDINPLVVDADGCVALDALVVGRRR